MSQPSHSYGSVNWRAIFWWLGFSGLWTEALELLGVRYILAASVGALLGFLTLCGMDIWMAWRTQRSLEDEVRRKFEKQYGRKR